MKTSVLDLFCGAGGFTTGLHNSGYEVKVSIDKYKCAIETQKLNWKHIILEKDLTQFSPEQCFKETGVKNIDMIVGGPPCFVEDTKVLTDNGYKNIQDVKLSDKLLTHTNTFQSIVNLQNKKYIGFLYKIKVKYHANEIICTPEHPIYVRRRIKFWNNEKRKYDYYFKEPIWEDAQNLDTDCYVGMVVNNRNIIPKLSFSQKINQFRNTTKDITIDDINMWYMLGYFIGDGWTQHDKKKDGRNKYNIYFVINNKKIEEVLPILRKILKLSPIKNSGINCTKFSCSNFLWWNILNMFGRYAHGKKIPEWVQDAPIEFLDSFIKGYKMADGCIKTDTFTTVSLDLAHGIQRIILKCGYLFSVSKYTRPKQTIIEGRIVNQRDTYQISGTYAENDNIKNYFVEDDYVWSKIFTHEKIEQQEKINVYNFEVEKDNSYIVENLIAHNCQSYSMAGKRDIKDPRGSLFMEFVRYVQHYKPKVFIMENVPGILTAKNVKGELVKDIILQEFEKSGYIVKYQKSYSPDYGVPQKRRRILFVGVRKDIKIPYNFPEPILSKENHIPVSSVLLEKSKVPMKYFCSKVMIEGFYRRLRQNKEKGLGFGAQFLKLNEPSYTISARYYKDGSDALVKYADDEIRMLTPLEVARIQTFPDTYKFAGSSKDIYTQIGNAVPCKLIECVGKSIKEQIFEKI